MYRFDQNVLWCFTYDEKDDHIENAFAAQRRDKTSNENTL